MSVGKNHKCPHCGRARKYSYIHDAFYCDSKECNKWLEGICDDLECVHCSERPRNPKPE